MGMGHMIGGATGGGGGWGLMRSLRRDQSVTQQKLPAGIVRRIARFAKPYRAMLGVFLVLIVVDATIGAANPLIYRGIINSVVRAIRDHGAAQSATRVIVILALVVGLLAVIDAGLSLWQRWVSARIGEGLIFDMRAKVFEHVQRMPVAFFSRTQTGALVSRLNNDVLGAQQAFTDTFSSVVSNVIGVGITLGAMFILSWQITLVALALLPLFLLPARWVGRRLASLTRESYVLNAQMTNTMTERFNVAGALLVKLFGHRAREIGDFEEKAGRVRDIGVTQAIYARVFMAALLLTASLATAVVYGWGGISAARGALSIGTVVALTAYLNRLYGPLTALSNVQVDVMTALVSFDRVFEVLDLAPMIDERPDAQEIRRGPALVELDHVDFAYPTAEEVSLASLESVAVLDQAPSSQVLFDVSVRAEPGQLVALVGPSGAGKTTISHLVPRLYDVDEGAVRINGIDVRDATLGSIHAIVGMVTQDAHLFHESIRYNLLYAKPDATAEELTEALRAAQILPLVESLPDGLDTVVGDRGYRLSGGEKQRIAIARLLLKAPDVVVLDEATAHLDSESESAVQQALKTALADRTSIVIAHRLSTVREADKILVVSGGRIVEEGTHTQLLAADGLYAELYRTQFAQQASAGADPTGRACPDGTSSAPPGARAAASASTDTAAWPGHDADGVAGQKAAGLGEALR
jgi:ATP-binding cassette subfamily B protein